MTATALYSWLGIALHLALQAFFIGRALLWPHREPSARLAWIVVILAAPILGMVAYLLFGETNLGRRRMARLRAAMARLPDASRLKLAVDNAAAQVAPKVEPLFRLGASISGMPPVGGNRGELLADSNATIDALVADIDRAREHVHLLFYIWLPDGNGLKVAQAAMRAAGRGVAVRVMVDDLGSRLFVRSPNWAALAAAGVRTAVALPIGRPLLRVLKDRIDMRNHRKIMVIDHAITYCGSQNCADPQFRIKAKFAPWVDAVMRFEGPIARQNQRLFAADWMAQTGEDLGRLLAAPLPSADEGFIAQVIGTGAAVRHSAMPEMFEALMYAARRELVITTPYYVPDEAMQSALRASARRGVQTMIVFPARNDSWIVGAASRSHYAELLDAGVKIFEYRPGLLHTKSLTLDGEITLIGSANMDRRSFELNSENNILLHDRALTAAMRARQESYIADATPVTADEVQRWGVGQRLRNNAVAMFSPVL